MRFSKSGDRKEQAVVVGLITIAVVDVLLVKPVQIVVRLVGGSR